jgi:hypothetical protein
MFERRVLITMFRERVLSDTAFDWVAALFGFFAVRHSLHPGRARGSIRFCIGN